MEKLKYTIVVVLCTLGVLFIILMLMPDDEEDEVSPQENAQVVETVQEADVENTQEPDDVKPQEADTEEPQESDAGEVQEADIAQLLQEIAPDQGEETTAEKPEEQTSSGNSAEVHIPSSELSRQTLRFKTVTLDNKKVSQDIFSDYDLTIVHIWATYCGPCIAEMGDYADFYSELPDNVNLVGLIADVYDGIDSNVADANQILSDAEAGFMNLRTSDDLYDLMASLRRVPSTFFVDREGHVIGGIMDGTPFRETKQRLADYVG